MSAGVLAPGTGPSTKFANHLNKSSAGLLDPPSMQSSAGKASTEVSFPNNNHSTAPFQAMKKLIGICLESELDAEAYASRIERDPRFQAIILSEKKSADAQEHIRIDLLLSDRCPRIRTHFSVSDANETGKYVASIDKVVRLPRHLTSSCTCCHRAADATKWSQLLSFVSRVLELNPANNTPTNNSMLRNASSNFEEKQGKRTRKLSPAARRGLPVELDSLTRREIDILQLVGTGLSVKEMAKKLKLAESTIGNHKYRLMRKLNVSSSLGLLRIAVRCGLSELWDSPPTT